MAVDLPAHAAEPVAVRARSSVERRVGLAEALVRADVHASVRRGPPGRRRADDVRAAPWRSTSSSADRTPTSTSRCARGAGVYASTFRPGRNPASRQAAWTASSIERHWLGNDARVVRARTTSVDCGSTSRSRLGRCSSGRPPGSAPRPARRAGSGRRPRRATRSRARARNHVRWRLASSVSRRRPRRSPPRASACRRARRTPRDSRSRRRPERRGSSGRGARRPPRRGRRRTGRARGPRSSRDASRGRRRRGRATATGARSRAPPGSGRSPWRYAISRARTTRRGLREVDVRGEGRREVAEPLDERRQALRLELELQRRAQRRVRRDEVEREPARDGAEVEPGAADEERPAAARGDLVERRRRAWRA